MKKIVLKIDDKVYKDFKKMLGTIALASKDGGVVDAMCRRIVTSIDAGKDEVEFIYKADR